MLENITYQGGQFGPVTVTGEKVEAEAAPAPEKTEAAPADDAGEDSGQEESDDTEAPGDAEDGDADAEDETEGDAEDDESEGDEDDAEDKDEIEVNYGGTKVKFKKGETVEQAAERLQNFANEVYGDYTKKTQKTAAQAKALESRAEELEVINAGTQQYFEAYGTALTTGKYLDELRAIDMPALWRTNADEARRVSDEIRRAEGVIAKISGDMQQIERNTLAAQKEMLAKRAEEGKKAVEAKIPGFEAKHAKEVVEYVVKNYNISEEDAQKWALSPDTAIMAAKAMWFDKGKAAAKAPPKAKKVEAPVKAIKGRGTARKPDPTSPESDKMSDDEWFAARKKQVYRR